MVPITSLWLPVLLASVGVFIASSVLHMLLTYHRKDYDRLPDEDAVLDALAPLDLPPGDYLMPHCTSPNDMKDETVMAKLNRGPVGMMNVWPKGPPTMGASLAQWFGYTLLVGVLTAYLSGRTLAPGTAYMEVFRFVGTFAFAAYALGSIPESVWYKRKWATTFRFMLDGFVYALVTAGVFGWLWPAA